MARRNRTGLSGRWRVRAMPPRALARWPVAVLATVFAAAPLSAPVIPSSAVTAPPGRMAGQPPSAGRVIPASAAQAQRKAEAIISPSLVYVTVRWRGYVWTPRNTVGVTSGWTGPYTAYTTCSGFAASADGYIVTAGRCVDDRSMAAGGKTALIATAVAGELSSGALTETQAAALAKRIGAMGRVAGTPGGGPPNRDVTVHQPAAAVTMWVTGGLPAAVIDYRSLEDGDVGLLKFVPVAPVPVLKVAARAPAPGTEVVAAGYPGATGAPAVAVRSPAFKKGITRGVQMINHVPFIEISAPTTTSMCGGPAVNPRGEVLGTVSSGPLTQGQPFDFMTGFRFMTGTGAVQALLTRNGVPNRLSAADRAYRAGLDDYFAGRYRDAVSEFDHVLQVQNINQPAQDFRREAVGRSPKGPAGPSILWASIPAAIIIAAVVALILVGRRRAAAAPPKPLETVRR